MIAFSGCSKMYQVAGKLVIFLSAAANIHNVAFPPPSPHVLLLANKIPESLTCVSAKESAGYVFALFPPVSTGLTPEYFPQGSLS